VFAQIEVILIIMFKVTFLFSKIKNKNIKYIVLT